MYWLDHNVENLVRIFDQNERKDFLRLDLNENPGGLPREFVESVLAEVTPQMVAQYPETLHFTQVLADYIGTDITNIYSFQWQNCWSCAFIFYVPGLL